MIKETRCASFLRYLFLSQIIFWALLIISPQIIKADGFKKNDSTFVGQYDLIQFGVGLYGSGSGKVNVNAPGEIVAAFIDWVGADDNTPDSVGMSTLIINGIEVVGTRLPGDAGISNALQNPWYAWQADIGPSGYGIVASSPTELNISGWDNESNSETNGATITIIFKTDISSPEKEIVLYSGVDYYYSNIPDHKYSNLLVFEFESTDAVREGSFYISFAGTELTQTDCRGNAVWMLAGESLAPSPTDYNLVNTAENGRGYGINGGVEILNDPFISKEFSCTPSINPTPDQQYEDGHPYPGGAPTSPYRAVSLEPITGGYVGAEWSVIKVEVLIPANSTWIAFQFESEDDQIGESGSLAGATTLTINPIEKADLSLTKTVDDNFPYDGDVVTFTVTLINEGPDSASNVEVTDILPEGMVFDSAIPSKGDYNENTGVWTVGNLNNGETATLTIKASVDIALIQKDTFDLGPAADYNLFVFSDLNQPSSDTQGKLAVGRDAYLTSYSVGYNLINSSRGADVLIAGRELTFISGAVYGGNVVYGDTSNLPTSQVSILQGTVRKDSVIDFNFAQTYLNNLSNQLAGYNVNGTTTFEYGGLFLSGTDPLTNVFHVSGNNLSMANNMEINIPKGSVGIVNIDGNMIEWSGGLTIYGGTIENVLYNFYQADTLTIHHIDIRGSVLAPRSFVDFISGVQNGQMVAKNLVGTGQFNNTKFTGYLPLDSVIVNIAEVTASDQDDPDSTPNNGNPQEDDYSSATITITEEEDTTGTGSGYEWQYISNFTNGEFIWTLTKHNNNYFAGTMGGKIYLSSDQGQSWGRINNDMSVAFIWYLAFNSDDHLFAATERGIYRTSNLGASWEQTGLMSSDVRSLVFDRNDNLYAGVWGTGIYKSTNSGTTWSQVNNGLGSLAVHALTADSSGNILFAGFYDGGVARSSNFGESWELLVVGYRFIWALGVHNNEVFAGTYGGGVYRSTDLGNSWENVNKGLPARFIYGVTADFDNSVYVAAWSGGVYKFIEDKDRWTSLGMNGKEVSAIMIDDNADAIYAATSTGALYRSTLSNLETEENGQLSNKFKLEQNYPNPFNPNTTIEFYIPKASQVDVSIFNILGEKIVTLLNENMDRGRHKINWNAVNSPSGLYFYRLSVEHTTITKKMILLK